jgi:hypothetical protein
MFSDQPTTISTTLLPSSSGVDLSTPGYPTRPLPFTQPQYTLPWPNVARSVEPMTLSATKLLSGQQLCVLRVDLLYTATGHVYGPCYHQSIQRPSNVPNKTQFIARIKLLHVSASGCHPQGVFQIKGILGQHVRLGTASSLLKRLKY